MNNVSLVGRLTADPKLTHLHTGTPVGEMRLAVPSWVDGECHFVSVTSFGRLAEACAEHLAKGRQVAVNGRLRYAEWVTDGTRRSKLDVVADEVTFLGAPARDESAAAGA